MTNLKGKNLIILILAIVCLVLAGGLVYSLFGQKIGKDTIDAEEAEDLILTYINSLLEGQPFKASLIGEIEEEAGLYKLQIKVGNEELLSYLTKDGKIFFPQGINLEEAIVQTSGPEETQSSSEVTISPEELTKFIACLKEANFVIYGANWCGWTKKLVEMLGGFDMVKPIYVECTEEEELCREKKVQGYPTILIKGEQYQGARTFKDFSAATGCKAPSGAEFSGGENSGGGGCQ